MGRLLKRAAAACALLCTVACAGVPRMQEISQHPNSSREVTAIVRHVLCEVARARDVSLSTPATLPNARSLNEYYVAYNLSIRVEDSAALTPALNWIDPLSVGGTSAVTSVGGELSRGRLRTFVQSATIQVKQISTGEYCPAVGAEQPRVENELAGSLGLVDVVTSGLEAIRTLPAAPRPLQETTAAPAPPATDKPSPVAGAARPAASVKDPPSSIAGATSTMAFGSTIQFAYRRALNGARQMNRTSFRGPSGSSGLFGGSRTDTDQLIIGFAPLDPANARRVVEQEIQSQQQQQR